MRIGSEWFPLVIGTFALSLISWMNSVLFNNVILFEIGKTIYFIALFVFLAVLGLWIKGYVVDKEAITQDLNNLTRVAFSAFIGVILFIMGFFFIVYIGVNTRIAYALLILYFVGYAEVLTVNIFTGYKLFTQPLRQEDLNYSVLVPSIALSANVILSAPLLPPSLPYISPFYTKVVYFIMLVSVGITFFQFMFLGSVALLSHLIFKGYPSVVMIPVGASSVLAINILTFPSYNYLDFLYFPEKVSITLGIILFGFELWNLTVGLIIAISRRNLKPNLAVWAYVFPLAISSFSDFLLYEETTIGFFKYLELLLSIVIILFYVYSMRITFLTIKDGEKENRR
ncbi:hypothetical protein [Stygiolobus caldivivus]|uniref:C4-dicarboxylate ABC transporter n=1 Tax=Stygiolobus caldivivus TaxID=2824673 RepID=A0A8D5ZK95_9CREN|nr:hypothetical protein [Stygiolobus caldivivus]BCU71506.1 C4-dicarboxylate ABC transporter [Stygiolobus caldivivus]